MKNHLHHPNIAFLIWKHELDKLTYMKDYKFNIKNLQKKFFLIFRGREGSTLSGQVLDRN